MGERDPAICTEGDTLPAIMNKVTIPSFRGKKITWQKKKPFLTVKRAKRTRFTNIPLHRRQIKREKEKGS